MRDGMWRYADRLPAVAAKSIVSLGERGLSFTASSVVQ